MVSASEPSWRLGTPYWGMACLAPAFRSQRRLTGVSEGQTCASAASEVDRNEGGWLIGLSWGSLQIV